MKVIYSYWQSNNHFFCDLEMAKMSNDFAKKCGYKTCLYTDNVGLNLLAQYVNYDEIILFDEKVLSGFYPRIWSLGKILAMSLIKEPFIHLDFDLFLIQPLNFEILQKDFFSLYDEPWINTTPSFINIFDKIINLYPNKNEIDIQNNFSYNFSVVGGNKIYEINTACKKIIDFAISFKEKVESIYEKNIDKTSWFLPVIFEQVLIQNFLLKNYNIKIETIFPKSNLKYLDFNCKNHRSIIDKRAKDFLKINFIKNKIVHIHGVKTEKFEIFKKFIE